MLSEVLTYAGAAYTTRQVLRLPSPIPLCVDLRRMFFLGWVTIETKCYLASAKVHYKARLSQMGIAGSRVHELLIWHFFGQTEFPVETAIYRHFRGNVRDQLDDYAGSRDFLNLILEYFK